MKISARTNYACLAMLELSQRYGSEGPVRIREIAGRHNVPAQFLVQILLQLKRSGLIASTRGAAGGYQLTRPPDEVSLQEVVAAVGGSEKSGTAGRNGSAHSPAAELLNSTWLELAAAEQEMLSGITLADLSARLGNDDAQMYHI